jgi:hypothetical protein
MSGSIVHFRHEPTPCPRPALADGGGQQQKRREERRETRSKLQRRTMAGRGGLQTASLVIELHEIEGGGPGSPPYNPTPWSPHVPLGAALPALTSPLMIISFRTIIQTVVASNEWFGKGGFEIARFGRGNSDKVRESAMLNVWS